MRKVLVIITNPQQASYRLRIEALREPLDARGIRLDVQIRPTGLFARRSLLKRAGNYDAVILQRKLLDPSDARLLRRHAKKILYDIDDAVMYHAHQVGRISQWRTNRRFEATAQILDHVVAGNEYLAEMFRQRGREVTVLPTCVDPAHYRVKQHDVPREDDDDPEERDLLRLVWIGSSSTLPYLAELLPVLREMPKVRLVNIADKAIQGLEGMTIELISWRLETEADSLIEGDIGIAPTPDDRWTRGKCGFKIVQYMAAGLPVIASPVGANAQIVREGETGFLANTPQQWAEAIGKLKDLDLRRRMGAAGRARVESQYSLTRALYEWTRLLDS